MLYLIEKSTQTTIRWHVGETTDFKKFAQFDLVKADGDELDYIKANFSNIPFSNKRVNIWEGEYARFIINNF